MTAYLAVRSDVLSGRYLPGEKLKIAELAQELAVSAGTAREALSRLVSDGIVVVRDQRGFAVAPLSMIDLLELTDLRCDVEAIALRRSVEKADVDWEAALMASEHRLRMTPSRLENDHGVNREWIVAHAAFHAALIAGCRNHRLIALHATLYEQAGRYRAVYASSEAMRDVPSEHRELLELALARDADGLVAAAVVHLRATTDIIIDAGLVRQTHAQSSTHPAPHNVNSACGLTSRSQSSG